MPYIIGVRKRISRIMIKMKEELFSLLPPKYDFSAFSFPLKRAPEIVFSHSDTTTTYPWLQPGVGKICFFRSLPYFKTKIHFLKY